MFGNGDLRKENEELRADLAQEKRVVANLLASHEHLRTLVHAISNAITSSRDDDLKDRVHEIKRTWKF